MQIDRSTVDITAAALLPPSGPALELVRDSRYPPAGVRA